MLSRNSGDERLSKPFLALTEISNTLFPKPNYPNFSVWSVEIYIVVCLNGPRLIPNILRSISSCFLNLKLRKK